MVGARRVCGEAGMQLRDITTFMSGMRGRHRRAWLDNQQTSFLCWEEEAETVWVESWPPDSCVEAPTPRTSGCNYIWK